MDVLLNKQPVSLATLAGSSLSSFQYLSPQGLFIVTGENSSAPITSPMKLLAQARFRIHNFDKCNSVDVSKLSYDKVSKMSLIDGRPPAICGKTGSGSWLTDLHLIITNPYLLIIINPNKSNVNHYQSLNHFKPPPTMMNQSLPTTENHQSVAPWLLYGSA